MKVDIYSRKSVTELIESEFPQNTAVISFCDPATEKTRAERRPVDYKGKCERLFNVAIHDIDIEILPDYGLTADTYFPEAQALAEFIICAERDGLDILCQCEYGQSRSAACAAAIKEYFFGNGITVFADYRYYPNQLVFNKVYDALRRVGNEIGK